MYAIVDMEYDYDYSNVESVTIYHNINTYKEHQDLCKEYRKIFVDTEKTRKARKIRKSLANSQALMKELGYPETWDAFLESKGITCEKVEFDIN